MWSIDSIKSIFGDYICRRCINHMFDAGLTREDCTYGYVYRCPCCGKKRNIVVGLHLKGRAKLLLRA